MVMFDSVYELRMFFVQLLFFLQLNNRLKYLEMFVLISYV